LRALDNQHAKTRHQNGLSLFWFGIPADAHAGSNDKAKTMVAGTCFMMPGQPFVDGDDADGGEVAGGEFLVSAGAKSWRAARGCAVWLADSTWTRRGEI
jgi:hypothetical protein